MFQLLKCPVETLPKQGPSQITPPGLPLQRQWYLYKQIREFVKDSLQDVVCPCPTESVRAACESDADETDEHAGPSIGRGQGGRAVLKSSPAPLSPTEQNNGQQDGSKPNTTQRRGRGRGPLNRGNRLRSPSSENDVEHCNDDKPLRKRGRGRKQGHSSQQGQPS